MQIDIWVTGFGMVAVAGSVAAPFALQLRSANKKIAEVEKEIRDLKSENEQFCSRISELTSQRRDHQSVLQTTVYVFGILLKDLSEQRDKQSDELSTLTRLYNACATRLHDVEEEAGYEGSLRQTLEYKCEVLLNEVENTRSRKQIVELVRDFVRIVTGAQVAR